MVAEKSVTEIIGYRQRGGQTERAKTVYPTPLLRRRGYNYRSRKGRLTGEGNCSKCRHISSSNLSILLNSLNGMHCIKISENMKNESSSVYRSFNSLHNGINFMMVQIESICRRQNKCTV